MTQSGQGDQPSAQPAREGIVLPSDGGEPLLPGPHAGGQPGPQPGPYPGGPQPGPYGPDPSAAAPAGGQAWGGAWGPGQQQPQQQAPQQAPQQWQQQPAQPQTWAGAGPLPQEGAQPPAYGGQGAPQTAAYAYPSAPQAPDPHTPAYGYPPAPAAPSPGYGYPPAPAAGGMPGATLPPADEGATQYLPPVTAPGGDEGATQYLPPVPAQPGPGAPGTQGASGPYGTPTGPAAHQAPQAQGMPPAHGGPAGPAAHHPQAPQAPGAQPAQASAQPHGAPTDPATHLIRPVGPGALPPERGAESTQLLGRAVPPGPGPLPPAGGPDAEATQYIAPVPGQPDPAAAYGGGADRQPPTEFDNLFRSGPGADGPAGATQQLPRIDQGAGAPGYAPQAAPPAFIPSRPGRDEDGGDERRRAGRTGSRLPLIAAIGVGIAVLGVGAGALLGSSGGDDDDSKGDASTNVSATAPATQASPSPSADPAKEQAVALDKLLADSGSSRAAVIKAVADVKGCRNLGQAATDLRAAAQQRTGLVTRLGTLQVDKLPDHAALTGALTNAWKASASADNHYAAWADQVAASKGKLCKKGQARATNQAAAGNRASGTASTEKKTAAGLWNAIARQYGLSERQPTQL
ncbi:hypothetical protein [Streptomyces griseosporeus]|uniref:hypothetical protein n=1 Tax=Streptomyces griseosporeus TaxID=1910 RepID=UPI0037B306AF